MFDIGGGELLLILLAILLLFGPKKIPELAQMLGKGLQQFRKAQSQFQSQLNDLQTEISTVVDVKDLNNTIRSIRNFEPIQPVNQTLDNPEFTVIPPHPIDNNPETQHLSNKSEDKPAEIPNPETKKES